MQKKQVYTRISAIQGLAFNSLKQLISWSNDFKVDQPQIDTQHESLCNYSGIQKPRPPIMANAAFY
ncbi:MAG: hypothetical protein NTX45_25525 [Proteobacteria bacterium]|nr:hypothetical protein [Pseudomonadota bacterium]